MLLMKFLDLNESEKQAFVNIWERRRKRGMAFFILRTSLLITLLWIIVETLTSFIDEGPSLATLSSIFGSLRIVYSWIVVMAVCAVGSVVAWFGCEEMYKNFKKA